MLDTMMLTFIVLKHDVPFLIKCENCFNHDAQSKIGSFKTFASLLDTTTAEKFSYWVKSTSQKNTQFQLVPTLNFGYSNIAHPVEHDSRETNFVLLKTD